MLKDQYTTFTDSEIGSKLKRPVLVTSINESIARNGKPFLNITMKDGFTEIVAKMFDTNLARLDILGVKQNSVADVEISVNEFQGGKSFIVNKIGPNGNSEITINDFIKMPPVDTELMFNEICDMLNACADTTGDKLPLSNLAITILTHYKEKFTTSSAAISMHHALRGGLIYHTYRMMKAADKLCEIYSSELDKELLLCGTALHDIGKLWEYKTDLSGSAEFTSSGVLFGHLYLGASIVERFSSGKKYNKEKIRMLIHLILSHHGTREFGAIQTPAIAEAFVLCYIDNIDAKVYMCDDITSTLEPGTMTDKRPYGVENRLYRNDYST